MSTAAHTENLTDDAAARLQGDLDGRFVAGGQLARVGRRNAPAVAGSAVGGTPSVDAQPREEPSRSRDRADVRVRPVRREDLFHPRTSLRTRVVTAVARWLTSSRGEVAERELDARLRNPAPNSRMNVATVTGQRGGVGKTSLVVSVGGLLADISRLNVVALDADLDYGPLADHVPDEQRSEKTVVDLLADFDGDQPVAHAAAAAVPVAHPVGTAGAGGPAPAGGDARADRLRSRPRAGACCRTSTSASSIAQPEWSGTWRRGRPAAPTG